MPCMLSLLRCFLMFQLISRLSIQWTDVGDSKWTSMFFYRFEVEFPRGHFLHRLNLFWTLTITFHANFQLLKTPSNLELSRDLGKGFRLRSRKACTVQSIQDCHVYYPTKKNRIHCRTGKYLNPRNFYTLYAPRGRSNLEYCGHI